MVLKKDFKDYITDIQNGSVAPIYFLKGDDFFLQNLFIKEVESALGKGGKINRLFIVPDVDDIDSFLADLNSPSLFKEPKLYILYNPTSIREKAKKELLDYCTFPNPDTCLIILLDKTDTGQKIVRELSNRIGSVTVSTPYPEKIPESVKFLLNYYKMHASPDSIDRLIELFGDSLYHLSAQIEKLKLSLGTKKIIEEEDVICLSGWEKSFLPWQFLDAMGCRDFRRSVEIGLGLLSHGTPMTFLIYQLTTLFQELYFLHLRNSVSGGILPSSHSLVYQGWLSGPVRKNLPKYQKKYEKNKLRFIHHCLFNTDRKLKSVNIKDANLLIPLIYKITV